MKVVYPLLASAFLILGCSKSQKPANAAQPDAVIEISGPFKDFITVDSLVLISDYISNIIENIDSAKQLVVQEHVLNYRWELKNCYLANNAQPLWVAKNTVDSALVALRDVYADGLRSSDYHYDALLLKISDLLSERKTSTDHLAVLDLLLTDAMLTYAHHLQSGKVDPKGFNEFYNFVPRNLSESIDRYVLNAAITDSVAKYISLLRPQNELYRQTQQSLRHYTALKLQGGWQKIDWRDVKKIEPGDTNALVPLLRVRLAKEGFLDSNTTTNDSVYSPAMQVAMAKFQRLHGLHVDSVVGKTSQKLLNLTVDEKIEAIRCNLERMRWGLGSPSGDFILVNAAAFRLYLYKADTVRWSTEIIIGAQQTRTPFFWADLTSIVLNPTWTVPYSIATGEIIHKQVRDSTYLARNNYVLLNRNGQALSTKDIDFSSYDKSNFPYVFRQEPGGGNALGHIKFNMPNPHYIYLHDTPSRSLFKSENRAFSHGCIRVNQPKTLATLLLNEQREWTLDSINSVINTKKTTYIKLLKPVPVYLTYVTHLTDAQGNAYFFGDVYGRDEKLREALAAPTSSKASK